MPIYFRFVSLNVMQKCRTVELSTIDTHPFSSGAKEKQTNKQTTSKGYWRPILIRILSGILKNEYKSSWEKINKKGVFDVIVSYLLMERYRISNMFH